LLGARAVEVDLDAVFALERADQRGVVVGRHVGIERERALALGAFDEALGAVGALVVGDLGDAAGLRRRLIRQEKERDQARRRGEPQQGPAQLLGVLIFLEPAHVVPSGAPGMIPPKRQGGQPTYVASVSMRTGLSCSMVSIVAAGMPRSSSIGTKSRNT